MNLYTLQIAFGLSATILLLFLAIALRNDGGLNLFLKFVCLLIGCFGVLILGVELWNNLPL